MKIIFYLINLKSLLKSPRIMYFNKKKYVHKKFGIWGSPSKCTLPLLDVNVLSDQTSLKTGEKTNGIS